MSLQVYSTLARRKEAFATLLPGVVSMYVCGPTVYSQAHIGHAMSVLVFDILRRYLEYRGYQVRHVMNYTDVDDKIILRANLESVEPISLAERYIHEFQQHLQDLNVLPATVFPRATQEIPQIISMIQGLIDKGCAYQVEGDVYFRVSQDADYGKLSGRRLDDMQAGARIDVDERKEHPMDFALWKASKPGEPFWDSPWGEGRPGWHIECSAMSLHHLGSQIDIHGGGNDLVFPHHENEIAQSESLTGQPFARYWIHNGMMQLAGEKMSKSLGNLITIQEFLSRHEADALRMMVLNSSYRGPLSYSEEIVTQAERALERLRLALRPVTAAAQPLPTGAASQQAQQALLSQMDDTRQGFAGAMDDDFNTAGALGKLFDLVRAINQARDAGVDPAAIHRAQEDLGKFTSVFGLRMQPPAVTSSQVNAFVDLISEVRSELRRQKLWGLSDLIRDRLAALGVLLEDSKDGTTWRFK